MATTKSGRVRTMASFNLRASDCSSALGASDGKGVRGSSGMPQIGQSSGSERMTSGCMGQVYSAPSTGGAEGAIDRLSAGWFRYRSGSDRKRSAHDMEQK